MLNSSDEMACRAKVLTLGREQGAECARLFNTRKFDQHCHGELRLAQRLHGMKLYDLLVTGAGGSGTNYVTWALGLAGVHVGHQTLKAQGTVSWLHAVNDNVVGVPYPFPRHGPHASKDVLPEHAFRFRTVVHLVRLQPCLCVEFNVRSAAPVDVLMRPLIYIFQRLGALSSKINRRLGDAQQL